MNLSDSSRPGVRSAPPRHLYFGDVLRVLAVYLVVVAHVALGLLYYSQASKPLPPGDWYFAFTCDALARWIVPCFVMLSGMFLLDPARDEPMAVFYRKRLGRVGVPLVVWTAIYMAWPYLASYSAYNRPELAAMKGWRGLVMGVPYYHLHFMFLIVGLYLFAPMLRLVVRHLTRRDLAITLLIALLLAAANSLTDAWLNRSPTAAAMFVPYIGYFLAGWWLRDVTVGKRGIATLWFLVALTTAIEVLGSRYLIVDRGLGFGVAGEYLASFLSPTMVVKSLCLFVLVRTHFPGGVPDHVAGRFVHRHLAPTTLGVYLIHPLVLDVVGKVTKDGRGLHWPEPLKIISGGTLAFVISAAIVWVMLRLPIVKRSV